MKSKAEAIERGTAPWPATVEGGVYSWPRGSGPISTLRALARRGLARELLGECEGCSTHRPGHHVPVFERL